MGTSILGKSWDTGVVFFSPFFFFFSCRVGGTCEFILSAAEKEGEREVLEKCFFSSELVKHLAFIMISEGKKILHCSETVPFGSNLTQLALRFSLSTCRVTYFGLLVSGEQDRGYYF